MEAAFCESSSVMVKGKLDENSKKSIKKNKINPM